MMTATTAHGDFANGLYTQLAGARAGTSLFLSPFSIQVALAMCAAGAKGETRKVLANLIGAPVDVVEQNRQYAAWLREVRDAGAAHVRLETANALWLQQGFHLRPEYQKAVADFYDGACHELDFQKAP